jgi:hypothetical protein
MPSHGLETGVPAPQVEDLELVGVDVGVLGVLEVDAPHPVATLLQIRDEVMADEATRTGDENPIHLHSQLSNASRALSMADHEPVATHSKSAPFVSHVESAS